MPRTKVIATYGPSLDNEATLNEALKYVDIVRLNFSHGTLEEKSAAIRKIRGAAARHGRDIAILADLPGPKIRVSKLKEDVLVKNNGIVSLCYYKRARGNDIPTDFDMYNGMKKGSEISIGDGEPKLLVTGLSNGRIICRALQDGVIKSRKGINVKGSSINAEPPTQEDIKFAKFAVRNSLDFIALSFVKSAKDVLKIKKIAKGMPVISKIERQEAIDDIEAIVRESDGIMIARGDMALNIDYNHVPLVQDKIISVCRSAKKPVIVATQMLASMTGNKIPTRAEMTDVANAVKSGVDCVMLSDETAVGRNPVEAITAMSGILSYTEEEMPSSFEMQKHAASGHEGIAVAVASISHTCSMDCIFIPSDTGGTAKMLSGLRPESTIVALSKSDKLRRNLNLYYGVKSADLRTDVGDSALQSNISTYARRLGIRSYMLVYGHQAQKSTSDSIKCFWGRQ